jgi:hypothetical protein
MPKRAFVPPALESRHRRRRSVVVSDEVKIKIEIRAVEKKGSRDAA